MALLDKLGYKKLLTSDAIQRSQDELPLNRVLKYAESLLPELGLEPRKLKPTDAEVTYQFGSRALCHIKAFPDPGVDIYLIVVLDDRDQPTDHILIDLGAEYQPLSLEGPQFGFINVATEDDIKTLIPEIDPDIDNPFAVLASPSGGTYIQTYREKQGFALEYQMVNTSSHYQVPLLLSAEDVVNAMLSYGWGNDEWLSMFDWKKLDLG